MTTIYQYLALAQRWVPTCNIPTYDLSSSNEGSHWSPGSGMASEASRREESTLVSVAPAGTVPGTGVGRGPMAVAGVPCRLVSWLPGFGGGIGGRGFSMVIVLSPGTRVVGNELRKSPSVMLVERDGQVR